MSKVKNKVLLVGMFNGDKHEFVLDELGVAVFFTKVYGGRHFDGITVEGELVNINTYQIDNVTVKDSDGKIEFDSDGNYAIQEVDENLPDHNFSGKDFVNAIKEISVDLGYLEALKEGMEEKYPFLKINVEFNDDFEIDEFVSDVKRGCN